MKILKHVGPLLAYVVYIWIMGSIQDAAPPGNVSDKTAHAVAFGLMVPVALLAVNHLAPRLAFTARVAAAVGTASALGALLEIWQLLLPWRSSGFLDWVADTVGALAVGAALLALRAATPRKG